MRWSSAKEKGALLPAPSSNQNRHLLSRCKASVVVRGTVSPVDLANPTPPHRSRNIWIARSSGWSRRNKAIQAKIRGWRRAAGPACRIVMRPTAHGARTRRRIARQRSTARSTGPVVVSLACIIIPIAKRGFASAARAIGDARSRAAGAKIRRRLRNVNCCIVRRTSQLNVCRRAAFR